MPVIELKRDNETERRVWQGERKRRGREVEKARERERISDEGRAFTYVDDV